MQDPSQNSSRCFEEGVEARANGRTLAENPYGIRTDDHREWQAGWHATCDLDEDDDPGSTRLRDGISSTEG